MEVIPSVRKEALSFKGENQLSGWATQFAPGTQENSCGARSGKKGNVTLAIPEKMSGLLNWG